jgi:hypothetical protein
MAEELRAFLALPPKERRREWEVPARHLARLVLRRLGENRTLV